MSRTTVRGWEELYQRYVNEVGASEEAPAAISARTRRAARGGMATSCLCTCSPMCDGRGA